MLKFFSKPWIAYVLPFLIILISSETALFLPEWRYQLLILGCTISAALVYLWRVRIIHDFKTGTPKTQALAGAGTGLLLGILWFGLVQAGISTPESLQIDKFWVGSRLYLVILLIVICYGVVIPLVSELFWRSFMLRYFITPDFKSVPLGSVNIFAFTMVVILGALPSSNHTVYLFGSSLAYTALTLWSKNLFCSTIAHVVANVSIVYMALHLKVSFY
jgi:CAAX prenyl protease-like protein